MDRPSGKTKGPIKLGASVRDYFGIAPGALKDHLNTVELTRITVTSLAVGGSTLGLLESILRNIGTICPAPTDAAFAAVLVTFILEAVRRLDHGPERPTKGALAMREPGENGNTGERHKTR